MRVAGLALAAALLLYGRPVGLGVTLVAAALLALTVRGPWALLAAALALVPAVRAAEWVQLMALAGAFAYAALAAGGFASVREAFAVAGRALAGLLPGPGLVLRPLLARVDGRWRAAAPAARGVGLATLLLLPFGTLFATADAAFAHWLETAGQAIPDLGDTLPGRALIALAVLAVAGALARVAASRVPPVPGRPLVGRTEWAIALGALNLLFAAFVVLQLTVLFRGHEYVQQTAGLTYAQYTHRGFWQLMVVAALTLVVIGATRRWTVPDRLQRLLLGGLCVLTLVVLASAFRRLDLYVEAYGMTRLRVLVEWTILTLGGLFALLLALHRVRRLPQALAGYAGLALLAFALSNPEGRIAARTDAEVRRTLSEDAGLCGPGELDVIGFSLARWRTRDLQPCAATS